MNPVCFHWMYGLWWKLRSRASFPQNQKQNKSCILLLLRSLAVGNQLVNVLPPSRPGVWISPWREVHYVRLNSNITVSIPRFANQHFFESTKTQLKQAYLSLCETGDFNSNFGIYIIIFRCNTSRCASKQADGNMASDAIMASFLSAYLSLCKGKVYLFECSIMHRMSCDEEQPITAGRYLPSLLYQSIWDKYIDHFSAGLPRTLHMSHWQHFRPNKN